jgi:uncharacterized membrane protein YfcA
VDSIDIVLLSTLIFAAAVLYSSVGHAGASGYLAAMALFGLAPAEMKPAALALNVLVGGIGAWRYLRAGFFTARVFWPLVLASVPMAFIGGFLELPGEIYKPVVGIVLVYAAWRMFRGAPAAAQEAVHQPRTVWIVLSGGAIGLLSGLTGVGGGIFLSPLLIMLGWAGTRQVSGISAAFILLNSIAGLAGAMSRAPQLPDGIAWWAVAAVAGGLIGTELGTRRFGVVTLRRVLALVLVVAGVKMILTA